MGETLAAIRQYVGERVKANAGEADVKTACSMWEALSEEGGAHRMASAEGLVYVARDGSMACKETATGALWNSSVTADNRVTIAAAGGIPVLVSLARDGSDEGKESAAEALGNLTETENDDNKVGHHSRGWDPSAGVCGAGW